MRRQKIFEPCDFLLALLRLIRALASVLAVMLLPIPGAAQSETVVIVPGPQYEASGVKAWLLGTDYRNLWTTPIRVPILDLQRFAGGLTPTETGGGRQTLSLRLRGADGREYTFRSVAKWPAGASDPDMAGALLGHVIQDQVSSMVPAVPLAAARIARAVGILHVEPNLFVMPDVPALGEFRETFGGMLGTLEERPGEQVSGGPAFGGFPEIISTEDMLDFLEEEPSHQADVRSYLFARLLDLVIGDWDRHEDQWRWGRRNTTDGVVWVPIPRDRDYSFADYDGVLLGIVRRFVPNTVLFEDDPVRFLDGLLLNASNLDRHLLGGLDRATWDSIAADLHGKLTDDVLDQGIAALPTEFQALEGQTLRNRLRARRDRLPVAASAFYARMATVPQAWATDADEAAIATRLADGGVELRISPLEGDAAGRTTFARTFAYPETKEIRVFLRGGDDRGVVRGTGPAGIAIRMIGGGGDDVLADSATAGGPTSFHEDGDDDVLIAGRSTTIDRHEYEEPADAGIEGLVRVPTPDYGNRIFFRPLIWYSSTRGALLGIGTSFTRYSFRRHPFESNIDIKLRYATRWADVGAQVRWQHQPANPALTFAGEVEASRIDALRFYGFGNQTVDDQPSSTYVVRREVLSGRAEARYAIDEGFALTAGAAALYSNPWVQAGTPLQLEAPLGSAAFDAAGVTAELSFHTEPDDSVGPVHRFAVRGSAFPLTSGEGSGYGIVDGEGALQIPLTAAGSTSVSARAGGRYSFGDYPFFESAFLGGIETLRGFPEWRYAGDGMVYGGVEAMVPLTRLPLGFNWRTAVFAFVDGGRVFLEGEDSDRWHTAPGVGLSLNALNYNVRLSYAHGPKGRVYLELGMPY